MYCATTMSISVSIGTFAHLHSKDEHFSRQNKAIVDSIFVPADTGIAVAWFITPSHIGGGSEVKTGNKCPVAGQALLDKLTAPPLAQK